MPDMWTHLVGGKLAVELVREEKWRRSILAHNNTYYLGCQAPDFFYYYNFQPWKRDKIGNLVSAAIHMERCQDFAVSLVSGLDPASPSYVSDVVFVLGFLCHWAIDRITHPYPYCRRGSLMLPSTVPYSDRRLDKTKWSS